MYQTRGVKKVFVINVGKIYYSLFRELKLIAIEHVLILKYCLRSMVSLFFSIW